MPTPVDTTVGMFSGGFSSILSYWWIFALFFVLAIIGAVAYFLHQFKIKKTQWTHKLRVLSELPDGTISDKEQLFNMRRWRHKTARTPPLFELEKPILGSRIWVELEGYSGPTEYKIVIGKDGRIYLPKYSKMTKDKNALEVSVKHAGIDRTRNDYNNQFEAMHATPKKLDAIELLKRATYALAIIAVMVVAIVGIQSWAEQAQYKSQSAQAELAVWEKMDEVMETVQATANTNAIIIADLKEYRGNNIQAIIQESLKKLEEE